MMQSQADLSLPLLSTGSDTRSTQKSPNPKLFSCFEIFLSASLPILIYVQFALVIPGDSNVLDQAAIISSVVTFFLASVMYRIVLSEQQSDSKDRVLVHLLPELIGLFAILLSYLDFVFFGFVLLDMGTLAMAITVCWHCATVLFSESSRMSFLGQLMTFALPLLILTQYHIAFANQKDMQGLAASTAQMGVVCFLLGSIMYRKVIEDEQIQATLFHLVPEVVAVGTVLFTIYGQVTNGFICLMLGDIFLALAVGGFSLRSLFRHCRETRSGSASSADHFKLIDI